MSKLYSAAARCPESADRIQFIWDSDTGIIQAEISPDGTITYEIDAQTLSWLNWINRREYVCKTFTDANQFALRYDSRFESQ